jgi:hypothetical protein
MKYMKKVISVFLALLGFNAGPVCSALYDRGGGLLYDSATNLIWLQDANYAKTSGYDIDGRMNLDQARTWAYNLVYHDSIQNLDYNDWRLPTGNEFAYMFVSNLGVSEIRFDTVQIDIGPVINLQASEYWLEGPEEQYYFCFGIVGCFPTDMYYGPTFATYIGQKSWSFDFIEGHAWAVYPGDVVAVPISGNVWFLSIGLLGLLLLIRKQTPVVRS